MYVETGLDQRFPIWSLGDVCMVAGFFFLSSLFFIVLGMLVLSGLPAFKTKTAVQIFGDYGFSGASSQTTFIIQAGMMYRL